MSCVWGGVKEVRALSRLVSLGLLLALTSPLAPSDTHSDWCRWRGPHGNSVSGESGWDPGKLIVLNEKGMLFIAEATPAGYQEIARAQALPQGDDSREAKGKCWTAPVLCQGKLFCRNDVGYCLHQYELSCTAQPREKFYNRTLLLNRPNCIIELHTNSETVKAHRRNLRNCKGRHKHSFVLPSKLSG